MRLEGPGFYEFGAFRFLPGEGLLIRQGQPVPLPPKALETLGVLLRYHGHVVPKDELMQEVWPDTFVEEGNLTQAISILRRALGPSSDGNDIIETFPKRGYRFAAPVTLQGLEPGSLLVHERTHAQLVIEEEEDGDSAPTQVVAAQAAGVRHRGVLIGALVATATIALALVAYRNWRAPAQPMAPIRSLAVLPFQPLAASEEDQILGLGMADSVIGKLAGLEGVVVRPTSAVRPYVEAPVDAATAGRALRVDAVLEGSLQRAGDRVRVSVQLLRVGDRSTLWAKQFDEQVTDIFSVQDAISRQVAMALAPALTREQHARLGHRHTQNVEAYQLYLKGRYHWEKRTVPSLQTARKSFEQALDADPTYALAYAGLADTYILLGNHGVLPQREAKPRAKAAALKALEIDETLAEAHVSLAGVLGEQEWNWAGAEKEFRRAIELKPGYALAHHWYAALLQMQGRFGEAIGEMQRTWELDPLSLRVNTDLGRAYYFARQYDRAIEQYQKTLEIDLDFGGAHSLLGLAYLEQGRFDEAIAELQQGLALTRGQLSRWLGYAYARAGRRIEALEMLSRWQQAWEKKANGADVVALIYVGLGEKELAFEWLERAIQQDRAPLAMLKAFPYWDPLRGDPRFQDLLRRVGLPQESAGQMERAPSARTSSTATGSRVKNGSP